MPATKTLLSNLMIAFQCLLELDTLIGKSELVPEAETDTTFLIRLPFRDGDREFSPSEFADRFLKPAAFGLMEFIRVNYPDGLREPIKFCNMDHVDLSKFHEAAKVTDKLSGKSVLFYWDAVDSSWTAAIRLAAAPGRA